MAPDLPAATGLWMGTDPAAGAGAIDATVRSMSPAAIVALAAKLRSGQRALGWYWDALRPSEAVVLLGRAPVAGPAALLTLHRNGYVRQVGLAALAQAPEEHALPFLVLRLDDIVPQLREMARVAVEERLQERFGAAWTRLLPLVTRMAARQRAGASATLRAIERLLLSTAVRPVLVEATHSDDLAVRRAAMMLLVRRGELGDAALPVLDTAIRDRDPSVARWAATEITSRRSTEAVQRALVPRLAEHRDPGVRRRAVLHFAKRGEPEPVERALFDPRASIRFLAREKLHAAGSHAKYVEALARPDVSRHDLLGALAGMAEVGTSADAELCAPYLRAADPRILAEAVRCVGALAPDRYRAVIERCAESPLRRVRSEAERVLARRAPRSS